MEILGVITAIFIIITLLRRNKHLGGAMVLGALTVAVFAGMNPKEMVNTLWNSITDPTTINLMLIVLFINIFSTLLQQTNSLEIMVNSLTKLLPDHRVLLVTLPSLIGMLTVPGGAVLSAPLIKDAGEQIKLTPAKLAATNMLYRHVWHLIFPLIPSIIIISELSQVPLRFFILFNLPVFIITFLIGFKWLFRNADLSVNSESELAAAKDASSSPTNSQTKDNLMSFIKSIFPLFTAIALGVFTPLEIPVSLSIGIILAAVNYIDWNDQPVHTVIHRIHKAIFKSKYGMVLTILGIMIFKGFVEASGAVEEMTEGLVASGIPTVFLIVLVPVITAMITGVNSAALGISYPIMAPIMNPHEGNLILLGIFYTASLFGYFMSPFHLCLLLTKEYFKTSLSNMYRELAFPASIMVIGGIMVAVIWELF